MQDRGFAKINLALHVRARRDDGYHVLETLFAFADDGDRLTAAAADTVSLAVDGPFAADICEGNLVLDAARDLRSAFGIAAGAALTLDKRLPVASGIGGGSADAAAALRLLCGLWAIDLADPRVTGIAAELGADVPACLAARSALGIGRGDMLRPFATPFEGAPLLLVNPRVPMSTGAVFRGWDGVDRGPLDPGDPTRWRNDLEAPARRLAPVIGDVLAAFDRQAGVRIARMSGSGATCFALFEDEGACDIAAAAMPPDWWRMAARLR